MQRKPDDRFSGTNNERFVGHILPEAVEGDIIALVKDGDMIEIDIPKRNITVHVYENELIEKRKQLPPNGDRCIGGYLAGYRKMVGVLLREERY